jgi:hypothetical protein
MKKILASILIVFSISSYSLDETQVYRLTNDIFGYLHIDQWIDYVKRIKTDEEIPNFYNYPPVSKETKYYFKKFDILGYEEGLRKHIAKNLTASEIQSAHDVLKNPFIAKVLKSLFLKKKEEGNFQKQVLLARDIEVSNERRPLVKSIYNLASYSPMADHMLKTIHASEKEQREIQKVLQKDNQNISMAQTSIASTKRTEVEHVFHVKIDKALQNYKINELRQFIALINKDSVQKFLSVYNTYDYFFMHKFDQMLYKKNMIDEKRGLKVK